MQKQLQTLFLGLTLCLFTTAIQAQYVGFTSLFRPGARVGVQYMPSDLLDETNQFGYSQIRTALIVPLSGGADLNLKKLRASAQQSFLNFNAGIRQYELNNLGIQRELGNFSLGLTGVKASVGIGTGIWAYTVQAGFLQSLESSGGRAPFAMAALLKIKIKGLNRQNFFGGGLVYAGKRLLPIPLIGIRRKLAKKLHLTALFPVQLDITKKFSKSSRLSWLSAVNGFSSTLQPNAGAITQEALFSFSSFRSSFIYQLRASGNLKLFFEAGMNLFGQAQIYDSDRENKLFDYDAHFTPYAGITARFNFGKSILGSQMFGNDM